MRWRGAGRAAGLFFAVAAGAVSGGCGGGGPGRLGEGLCPTGSTPCAGAEVEIAWAVNEDRRAVLEGSLALDPGLGAAAREAAIGLAASREIVGDLGGSAAVIEASGPRVEEVIAALRASPGARGLLLGRGFAGIGVGVARAEDRVWVVVALR